MTQSRRTEFELEALAAAFTHYAQVMVVAARQDAIDGLAVVKEETERAMLRAGLGGPSIRKIIALIDHAAARAAETLKKLHQH